MVYGHYDGVILDLVLGLVTLYKEGGLGSVGGEWVEGNDAILIVDPHHIRVFEGRHYCSEKATVLVVLKEGTLVEVPDEHVPVGGRHDLGSRGGGRGWEVPVEQHHVVDHVRMACSSSSSSSIRTIS